MIDLTPYTDSNGDIDLKKELIQELAGIVESGSNENGRYVKFEDGTQMCWHRITRDSVAITSAYGSLFREGSNSSWAYPASFVEIASATVFGDLRAPYSYINGFLAQSLSYRCAHVNSNTENGVNLTFFAIGRWK